MNIIGELNMFLERAEQVKGDDARLISLLNDLETKYQIPKLVSELDRWQEENPDADRILQTYRFILSLRSV